MIFFSLLYSVVFICITLIGIYPYLSKIRETYSYSHNKIDLLFAIFILSQVFLLIIENIIYIYFPFLEQLFIVVSLTYVTPFQALILVYWKQKKDLYLVVLMIPLYSLIAYIIYNLEFILILTSFCFAMGTSTIFLIITYKGKKKDLFFCSIWEIGVSFGLFGLYPYQHIYIFHIIIAFIFLMGMFRIGFFKSFLLTKYEKERKKKVKNQWISERVRSKK